MTNANQEPMLLLKNAVVCISAGGRRAKSLALHQVVSIFVSYLLCQMNAYSREYIDTLRSQKEGRWGTPILKRSLLGKWQTQQAETVRCEGTSSRPSRRRKREWHKAVQSKGCLSAAYSAEGVTWIMDTPECTLHEPFKINFILTRKGRFGVMGWQSWTCPDWAVQVMSCTWQQEPGKQPWRDSEAQLHFTGL